MIAVLPWKGVVVSMVLPLVLACASSRPPSSLRKAEEVREGCLNSNHVRSFTPLHERFVYVRGRSGEHFLLTMDRYCIGLTEAMGITLNSTFARICSGSGAVLTYSHIGQLQTCGVRTVEVVPDKATAERLVHERTPPRPQER
jgi:hypothetical protein